MMKSLFGGGLLDTRGPLGGAQPPALVAPASAFTATVNRKSALPASAAAVIAAAAAAGASAKAAPEGSSAVGTAGANRDTNDPKTASIEWDFGEDLVGATSLPLPPLSPGAGDPNALIESALGVDVDSGAGLGEGARDGLKAGASAASDGSTIGRLEIMTTTTCVPRDVEGGFESPEASPPPAEAVTPKARGGRSMWAEDGSAGGGYRSITLKGPPPLVDRHRRYVVRVEG